MLVIVNLIIVVTALIEILFHYKMSIIIVGIMPNTGLQVAIQDLSAIDVTMT